MTIDPVTFDHVGKTYRDLWPPRRSVVAVADVSLRIPAGTVFGLLGPNRAGKTTLVKLLLGLCRPTTGRVERFGRPSHERGTLARVGYLHEKQYFPPYLTAAGLLGYFGSLSLLPTAVVRQRGPELLKRVGLADRAREPIARFSKGMLQRIGLAQALLNDPDLLILDEPTEGLDLEGRQFLLQVIQERKDQGKSVLLISHSLPEVERVCDHLAVLRGGRVVAAGARADLLRDPAGGAPRTLEAVLAELYQAPLEAAS